MPATPTVAWLGTGVMGLPMTRRLLAAGIPVRVWNRTRAKAEPLADDGATVCDSPLEAAQGADLLVTMMLDADAIAAAVDGQVLGALADGAVWAQTSTVGVAGSDRLAALAGDAGVGFVDCPVVGTRKPAEDGALVVLAAGPPDAVERCSPVFDAVGSRTVPAGEAGAASRLKLVVNTWIAVVNDGIAETVALARGLGVDPDAWLDAIAGGAVDAPYAHLKAGLMRDDTFPTSFSVSGAAKDARLILEAAGDVGVDVGLVAVVRTHLEAAEQAGYGDADMAAVVHAH